MDLNASIPAPQAITLGGRTVLVGELTMQSLGLLQAWIKANRPHPFVKLKKAKAQILRDLGPKEYQFLLSQTWDEAKDWPPSPLREDGRRLLVEDDRGSAELLKVALAQHGEDVTDEEAMALFKAASEEEAVELMMILWGVGPSKQLEAEIAEGLDSDPKAATPGPGDPAGPRSIGTS